MKKLLILGILCMTAALVLPALASQPDVPADGIKMKLKDDSKKEVVFNHSTHKDQTCVSCHHPVDGKEDFRPCGSAGCHDVLDAKDKTEKSFHYVMHEPKKAKHQTCMSCHLASAGDDKAKKKDLAGCAKSKCHP